MRVWRFGCTGALALSVGFPVLVASLTGCEPDGAGAPAIMAGGPVRPAPPAPPLLPWQAAAVTTASGTVRVSAPSPAGRSPASRWITPSASPALAPGPCLPLYGPGTPVPVTVSTTSGGAVLTWWHNGDPATIAYWVGIEIGNAGRPATTTTGSPTASTTGTSGTTGASGTSGTSGTVSWIRLAPPAGCRVISFTVPGLTSKRTYTLLLDLEASTPETASGTSRVTINQVAGVLAP